MNRLRKRGEDKAEGLFREAKNQLAQGDLAAARRMAKKVLKMAPSHIGGLRLAGFCYLKEEQPDRALQYLKKAVALNPASVDANSNLSLCLKKLGRSRQALAYAIKATQLDPESPELQKNLLNLHMLLQRWGEALLVAERLRDMVEASEEHYVTLAQCSRLSGEYAAALAHVDDALAHNPASTTATAEKLFLLELQGDDEAAFAFIREQVAAFPSTYGFRTIYVGMLLEAGEKQQATDYCLSLLEEYPRELHPILVLARLGYFDSAARLEQSADRLLQTDLTVNGEPDEQVSYVVEEIRYLMNEGVGDRDIAFQHLAHANRLYDASLEDDFSSQLASFSRIKTSFSTAGPVADSGIEEPRLIFIVGMPRSGSTLVEQILSSHSEVYGGDELAILERILQGEGAEWGYLSQLKDYGRSDYAELAQTYLSVVEPLAAGKVFITDKSLANALHIGIIVRMFPSARIIYCKRDALDNCFSCYKHFFEGEHSYAYDMRKLGQYYRRLEDLMGFWMDLYPDRIYEQRYEALVEDIGSQARQLIDFLGLAWEDQCEHFYTSGRKIRTASTHQVRQEVYKSAIGSSGPYREHLAPLMEALRL